MGSPWNLRYICIVSFPQNGSHLMITCLFLYVFCLSWVPYQAGTQDVSGTTKQHRLLPMEGSTAKVISPSLLKESFPAFTKFPSTGFSNKFTNQFFKKKKAMSKQASPCSKFQVPPKEAPSPRSAPLEDPYSFGQRPVRRSGDFGQTKIFEGKWSRRCGWKVEELLGLLQITEKLNLAHPWLGMFL